MMAMMGQMGQGGRGNLAFPSFPDPFFSRPVASRAPPPAATYEEDAEEWSSEEEETSLEDPEFREALRRSIADCRQLHLQFPQGQKVSLRCEPGTCVGDARSYCARKLGCRPEDVVLLSEDKEGGRTFYLDDEESLADTDADILQVEI